MTTAATSDRLWYVSYGSNLSAARLSCYLAGGRPPRGRRATPGARDRQPPADDRRIDLAHPLLFGGPSHTWHGGPAYLDDSRPGHAIGRAWLITHQQLEDIVAQENGMDPGSLRIPDHAVRDGGVVLPAQRYGRMVSVGLLADRPAVTFTYVRRPRPRAPDPAYLAMLRTGMRELGLSDDEISRALQVGPGPPAPRPHPRPDLRQRAAGDRLDR